MEVTLTLPTEIKVQVGKSANHTVVPVKDMSPDVLRMALLNGFIGALNNISRGEDDKGKPLSDAAWAAKRDAKVKVWLAGSWASTERGDSSVRLMKEQYISEQVAKGRTVSEVERTIKEAVKQAFGDKEAATFARFLDAVALAKEPNDAEARAKVRDAIEDGLFDRAQKAAAERAKTATKLDLTDIGL